MRAWLLELVVIHDNCNILGLFCGMGPELALYSFQMHMEPWFSIWALLSSFIGIRDEKTIFRTLDVCIMNWLPILSVI